MPTGGGVSRQQGATGARVEGLRHRLMSARTGGGKAIALQNGACLHVAACTVLERTAAAAACMCGRERGMQSDPSRRERYLQTARYPPPQPRSHIPPGPVPCSNRSFLATRWLGRGSTHRRCEEPPLRRNAQPPLAKAGRAAAAEYVTWARERACVHTYSQAHMHAHMHGASDSQ